MASPRAASLTELEAMRRAVDLARRGPAHGPNPRVGCVILAPGGSDGRDGPSAAQRAVLGEGWHRGAGTAHAEVAALADAQRRGADVRGATAVVTLEPCDHTGRTGPCSIALLEAGIGRVVISVADPNLAAAGGADRLRGAGVDVVEGILEEQGIEVLGAWLPAVERGRPFVTLKLAASLDGRVAAADGTSRWITSDVARAHAHRLRAEVDAIAVGTGTALADDPSLTARTASGELTEHQPLRVVVGLRDVPVGARLRGPGGELLHVRTHDPAEVLAVLAAREVRHVLVDGGPRLAAAFLGAGLVDEVHAYVAPVLLGSGLSAVADLGIGTIADAVRLDLREVVHLGPDVLIVATPTTAAPRTSQPGTAVPGTASTKEI
ncbi:bifunctional diaminohydroxyphosphoribosylaminopyrimidine deaminase/5-amino-6-(5-phosphoribosylamino)uracil reductase RibD (plasmid) [Cellulomonas sp. WB94]|uniref:bifunctional diaminohydroxyphosphoribosylaminopyrimidine deaminase/5-amino-6-(5-phosphoribosylamino)uracil reductase RibD n=1 Tax=Cellulomonas sp. WB94 TaxID=2173174 RepID=UPI000D56CE0F|nr:bifunctional diaminohydroxyphosphoribosylaminopyrimidine deaminase/5-amino-6-(5-phosphoribosylamino)uracil reductase RibD [Cellulomonas sp. WB94]PVU81823.1 bifunctional diaminohydroxyphosphoribosylaminopyrimidine deaminase/5-amino-6-(5-phosphoribosylamino)uracil reductase RibD [Cellulomonas sp. WB94]